MNQVAEGVKTCRVVRELADELGVDMPITAEVVAVCHEGRTAEEAYRGLVRRQRPATNIGNREVCATRPPASPALAFGVDVRSVRCSAWRLRSLTPGVLDA